jgi:hypothetical protein
MHDASSIVKPSQGDKMLTSIVKPSQGDKMLTSIVKPSQGDKMLTSIVKPSQGDKMLTSIVKSKQHENKYLFSNMNSKKDTQIGFNPFMSSPIHNKMLC